MKEFTECCPWCRISWYRADLASSDEQIRSVAARELGILGDLQAVPRLIDALSDSAATVREAAAWALRGLGDRRAVPALGALLDDTVRDVQYVVALALCRLGGEEALRLLLDRACSDGPVSVHAAHLVSFFDATDLRALGETEIIELMIDAVRSERRSYSDSARHHMAEKCLAKLGVPAYDRLLAALDDPHDAVRHLAASVLGSAREIRALPFLQWMAEHGRGEHNSVAASGVYKIQRAHQARAPLIETLESGDRLARYGAAFQLAHLVWHKAAEVLVKALDDTDLRLRCGAAYWLGALRAEPGIAPLIATLGDSDSDVRRNAANALRRYGPAVAPAVIKALSAKDANARAEAALVLEYIGDSLAVGPLVAALSDLSSEVRDAAANSLEKLFDTPIVTPVFADAKIIEALVAAFRNEQQAKYSTRFSIMRILAQIDARRAVDLLSEALGNGDKVTRELVAGVLGGLGDRRAIPPLITALSDLSIEVRGEAANALGRLIGIGGAEALETAKMVEALIAAFRDNQETSYLTRDTIREALAQIVKTLAQIDAARAVELLLESLVSGDSETRRVAAHWLGLLGDPRAIAPLNAALSDDSGSVREYAAYSLQKFADPSSVEPLIANLGAKGPYVRWAAIDALVAIGDSRAAGPLVDLLLDNDGRVRSAAAEAIVALADDAALARLVAQLGEELPHRWHYSFSPITEPPALAVLARIGERAIEPLIAAFTDQALNKPGRRLIGQGLVRIGEAAIARLLDGLGSADERRRRVCAEGLAAIGVPVLTRLSAALTNERAAVRASAAYALGISGEGQAIDLLIDALRDEDQEVRASAALALGQYSEAWLVEPLIAALDDPESRVRVYIARALANLGNQQGSELLIVGLNDKDVEVACFAAQSLGELGEARANVPLIACLESASSDLRAASASALGKIGSLRALKPLERLAGDTSELSQGGTVDTVVAAAIRRIRKARGV